MEATMTLSNIKQALDAEDLNKKLIKKEEKVIKKQGEEDKKDIRNPCKIHKGAHEWFNCPENPNSKNYRKDTETTPKEEAKAEKKKGILKTNELNLTERVVRKSKSENADFNLSDWDTESERSYDNRKPAYF